MGYYMRFFVTGSGDITLSALESALTQLDAGYRLTDRNAGRRDAATLAYRDGEFGQVEINRPGDGLFEEEIDEFREAVEGVRSPGRDVVLETLQVARAIVALQVSFQERDTESTLRRIDPLWRWLFEYRGGMLEVDGEGWYDRSGQVLGDG